MDAVMNTNFSEEEWTNFYKNNISGHYENSNEKLSCIEKRIVNIEAILEKLEVSVEKLFNISDLLKTVIYSNIDKSILDDKPFVKESKPKELHYKRDEDKILIYGNKTYSCKDTIKATFSTSKWNQERGLWMFDYYENCEKDLEDKFPFIIKDL